MAVSISSFTCTQSGTYDIYNSMRGDPTWESVAVSGCLENTGAAAFSVYVCGVNSTVPVGGQLKFYGDRIQAAMAVGDAYIVALD